jgi:hypothetical protein
VTTVYFRIGNLERQYQSVDYFTQLALICYDTQLKYYGYKNILAPLIEDLKTLETVGIPVTYRDEVVILKGTISYICQDNLAGNDIGGYITSFGCNVNCKYYSKTIK